MTKHGGWIGLAACLLAGMSQGLWAAEESESLGFFIGTRTEGSAGSRGIYRSALDPARGTLKEPLLAAEHAQPGFLAWHPRLPVLYAIGKARQGGHDALAAFRVGADGKLVFAGEAASGGRGVCHLAVDPTGRVLAAANYGDGSYSTLPLDAEGLPGEPVSVLRQEGRGPNERRQEGPHAHGVYFNRSGTVLFMPDLGLDRVFLHTVDAAQARMGDGPPALATAAGAGPRHLAFSPDFRHVYVINELDNTVLAATHEESSGRLSPLAEGAVTATLPEDFAGNNTTAEIEVHPNGRFVYASNRGHDSIAVFRRDLASGRLERVQVAPCGGKTPRHFTIAPGGRWLVCAHQDSNTISALPLDPETGLLSAPVSTIAAPHPICILFLPADAASRGMR